MNREPTFLHGFIAKPVGLVSSKFPLFCLWEASLIDFGGVQNRNAHIAIEIDCEGKVRDCKSPSGMGSLLFGCQTGVSNVIVGGISG